MTKTETFTFEPAATYCSLCHQVLDGPVVDLPIYKLGELDYIELAHLECAKDSPWDWRGMDAPGTWVAGHPAISK